MARSERRPEPAWRWVVTATRWQRRTRSALRALYLTREELDDEEYGWHVAAMLEAYSQENARLVVGEAVRATRVDDEGQR